MLFLASLRALALRQFAVEQFLQETVVFHAHNMTGPTKLRLHKDGVDARKRTLSKNRDVILPFDAENLPDRPYESSLASLYA